MESELIQELEYNLGTRKNLSLIKLRHNYKGNYLATEKACIPRTELLLGTFNALVYVNCQIAFWKRDKLKRQN